MGVIINRKEMIMLPVIIIFAATYVLMISFGKYRPWFAPASDLLFGV